MNIYTQLVVPIGVMDKNGISVLGTAFFISKNLLATPYHVIKSCPQNLVLLRPLINFINEYQDTSINKVQTTSLNIIDINPITDLAILDTNATLDIVFPELGSLDNLSIGQDISIYGYPHCTDGRRVLTLHKSIVGAKILLDSSGFKLKHAVLNLQSRPGQSGSLVFNQQLNQIVGILMGAYAPERKVITTYSGIDLNELNQTTYCISAEYIKDMLC